VYANRKYYVCTWLLNLQQNGKELLWLLRLKPTSISRHLASTAIIGEHYPPGLSAVDALEGMCEYLTRGLDSVQHDRTSTIGYLPATLMK
jgi:hypothetical protein